MGLTISHTVKTKDEQAIVKAFSNLMSWCEKTGRKCEIYESAGVATENIIRTHHLDGKITSYTRWYFGEPGEKQMYPVKRSNPSKKYGINIELKLPGGETSWYNLEFFKIAEDYWLSDDFYKVMGPGDGPEGVISETIQIIAILEYLKENFFPSLKITDETDFHLTPVSKVRKSQLQYWAKLKAEGAPDYLAQHKALKNHDIQSILRSIGMMNSTFSMVDKMLDVVGYKEENIVKNLPIDKNVKKNTSLQIENAGQKILETYKNQIKGYTLSRTRPRVVDLDLKGPSTPVRQISTRRRLP